MSIYAMLIIGTLLGVVKVYLSLAEMKGVTGGVNDHIPTLRLTKELLESSYRVAAFKVMT